MANLFYLLHLLCLVKLTTKLRTNLVESKQLKRGYKNSDTSPYEVSDYSLAPQWHQHREDNFYLESKRSRIGGIDFSFEAAMAPASVQRLVATSKKCFK